MRGTVCGLVACLSMLLVPAAGLAATPNTSGVHVDPGSPAGKQYAIPLSTARALAAGRAASGAPGGGGGSVPPLFGSGIVSPGTGSGGASLGGAGAGGGTAGAGGRSDSATNSAAATRGQGAAGRDAARQLAYLNAGAAPVHLPIAATSAGSGAWLPLTLGGIGVLLLGGGGGLLLRRRTR